MEISPVNPLQAKLEDGNYPGDNQASGCSNRLKLIQVFLKVRLLILLLGNVKFVYSRFSAPAYVVNITSTGTSTRNYQYQYRTKGTVFARRTQIFVDRILY